MPYKFVQWQYQARSKVVARASVMSYTSGIHVVKTPGIILLPEHTFRCAKYEGLMPPFTQGIFESWELMTYW